MGITTTPINPNQVSVLGRIRAALIEQGIVDLLHEGGMAERIDEEGIAHVGVKIALNGELRRLDLKQYACGKIVTIYGRTEITRDLMEAGQASGPRAVYEAENVSLDYVKSARPCVTFEHNGEQQRLDSDYIAGCDGAPTASPAPPSGANTERKVPKIFGVLLEHY